MSAKTLTTDTITLKPTEQPSRLASVLSATGVGLMAVLVIFVGAAGIRSVVSVATAYVQSLVLGLAPEQFDSIKIFAGLEDEPHFADESAMIAQSYYYTLFKSGQWNHPDWLHYAAYDHPPLPKYMFGLSLELAGKPVPQSIERWMNWSGYEWRDGRWVKSPRGGDFSPPHDPTVLFWARVPAAIFGVAGVLAIYFVGLQLHGRTVGVLAALLLVADPLYLTHARRAMSDSFTECLVIASVAVALWGCSLIWRAEPRRWRWAAFIASECFLCGLAALGKLNGGIACVLVLSMLLGGSLLAWTTNRTSAPRNLRQCSRSWLIPGIAALLIGMGSFLVFLALNPLLTARPEPSSSLSAQSRAIAEMGVFARARFLVKFRQEWTRDALSNTAFKKDWLRTTPQRMRMTLWEGFGRFSPLGPRDIRTVEPRPEVESFMEYRRWSSLIWFPPVAWGFLLSLLHGWRAWRSGRAPLSWGLILYTASSLAIVVFMIPLNWDRYYLPIQAPAALLVAFGIMATWQGNRNA